MNAVAPGPVATRWLAGRQEMLDNYAKLSPLGRVSKPEDSLADAVEFLAFGGSMVTGQVVVVDGGLTL